MNEKLSERELEALSAWYDGASGGSLPDPDSPAGARLAAYRAMTTAIANLEQPDVHPAFRTRVLAAVRDEIAAPSRRPMVAWRWITAAAGAAACVVLLLALGPLLVPETPKIETSDPKAAPVAAISHEGIYQHLAALPEGELAALVPSDFADEEPMALPDLDADSLVTVHAMGVFATTQADLGDLMNSLDSEQEARLKRLLIASVSEDE
jgi:hypothetical protein